MNFSKFDVSILLTMSLAVIIMSFMFPTLGMTSTGTVNETDIPEFNASASTFDLVGSYPEQPDRPTSGELEYNNQDGQVRGISLIAVGTNYSVGIQNSSLRDKPQFVLYNFTSGTAPDFRRNITGAEDQELLIENSSETDWVVTGTVTNVENYNEQNMTITLNWDVKASPSSESGISTVPIIGGIADSVANVLGQIAVAFAWGSAVLIETLISGVIAVFNLAQWMFGMGYWLVTTYAGIVSAAPSWAGVVLSVPGILLFAEFAKLTAIVISLFPTT